MARRGENVKFIRVSLFMILSIILLVACKSDEVIQEPIQGEKSFIGSEKDWKAEYLYDSGNNSNWIELVYKGSLQDFNLSQMDIEIESRDTLTKGNMGDMETKVDKNKITFLVGTINREMYMTDKFELKISYKGSNDIILLKAKE
jgi:hypothetical protein